VLGFDPAWIAAAALGAAVVILWLVVPGYLRRHHSRKADRS